MGSAGGVDVMGLVGDDGEDGGVEAELRRLRSGEVGGEAGGGV